MITKLCSCGCEIPEDVWQFYYVGSEDYGDFYNCPNLECQSTFLVTRELLEAAA